jgi:DUF1365 family protein
LTAQALRLWKGQTVHARYVPFERRFAYNVTLIDIDIDRLGAAARQSPLFSVDGPGVFSFHRKDHGARTDAPLRPWAEQVLAKAGIALDGGAIRLVTFPRQLFYKFAPISLWYGYGPSGDLRGIIYEVNNTFGETHAYAAAVSGDRSQQEADKAFHVSPFFDVTGAYRFTLRTPTDRLGIVVESLEDGARLHMANITARRHAATTGALLAIALATPFATLGVTLAIHWQALKIWLRGAQYRSRPDLPTASMTVAKPLEAIPPTLTKDAA